MGEVGGCRDSRDNQIEHWAQLQEEAHLTMTVSFVYQEKGEKVEQEATN